jgi:hypothetical protein
MNDESFIIGAEEGSVGSVGAEGGGGEVYAARVEVTEEVANSWRSSRVRTIVIIQISFRFLFFIRSLLPSSH